MRKVFRLLIFVLAISTTLSIYSLSSLTMSVNASCNTGWQECTGPNGTTQGGPGNRSGCSVTYDDYWERVWGVSSLGIYNYNCGGQITSCLYVYECPDDGPGVILN